MSRLIALHLGQEIASLELEVGHLYTVGRGSDCSIQLPHEKGVSREHLRIVEVDSVWTIELVSKTGELILDGESVSGIELSSDCRFSVPPFEFQYISEEASQAQETTSDGKAADEPGEEVIVEEATQEPEPEPDVDVSGTHDLSLDDGKTSDGIDELEDTLGSTMVGGSNLTPVLKVQNSKTGEEYQFQLEGSVWTAGRVADNEIQINDAAVSRRHFEVSALGKSFAIKDLGSSNGTLLNGKSLTPNEVYELSSEDKITIRHIVIKFEVRDANYEQKLAGLNELAVIPPQASTGGAQEPAVIKMDPPPGSDNILANPKVKMALMILAPVLLVVAIFSGGDNESGEKELPSNEAPATSKADLQEAQHLLEVAKNHYINRNYSFCVTQLEKLHLIVPSYQDSKELEGYCLQAIELEKEQADRAAQEQRQQEVQIRIQNIVDQCEQNQKPETTSTDMQICLQPALELNPEEPRALQLISDLELAEQQEQAVEQQQAARAARIRAGKTAYQKAVNLENKGRLKKAIKQYKVFLNGRYGLSSEESKARRSIASIDKKLTDLVLKSVGLCEKFLNEKKYKEAIENCNRARSIDPNNKKAKTTKDLVEKRLRIDMKKIWDSSVLEESFGNLEAAKSRWREIMDKSVPKENYYEKARNKLKSYGIE